jgi:hypothetical protein
MALIIIEHTETALEFLEALNPWKGYFSADYRQSFIFRGVGSADFHLTPSAFRPKTVLRHRQNSVEVPLPTLRDQIEAELDTLWEFFVAADRQGLRLPEDSQKMRQDFRRHRTGTNFWQKIEAGEPWPPDELISLMALAQHFRLPTRLLDWTWNPYIAAYFAAVGAEENTASICVWALSATNQEIQSIIVDPSERKLLIVSAPASDNPNLQAQRWAGLLYRHFGVSVKRPLTDINYEELAEESFGIDPHFYKLTLPTREAGELLRLLAALDINGSTLFPGFRGAADSVKEMSRWPDQFDWRGSDRPSVYNAAQKKLFEKHNIPTERRLPLLKKSDSK